MPMMTSKFSVKFCFSVTAPVALLQIILLLTFWGSQLRHKSTVGSFQILQGNYKIPRVINVTNLLVAANISDRTLECMKDIHTEYLTPEELEVWLKVSKRGCKNANCHFVNGTDKSAVPLVSFPGSGNTWSRGLLEKATGICTGSVYHDGNLAANGLVGETITSGSVLGVKIHGFAFERLKPIKKIEFVLYVIRNPFDALVAEYTRRNSKGHTGVANFSIFRNDPKWNTFVRNSARGWFILSEAAVTKSVLNEFKLHVIKFENLQTNEVKEMEKVVEFLGFHGVNLTERLKDDFGTFRRPHSSNFDHYTEDQKTIVNQRISQLIQIVKANDFRQLDFLSDYVMKR